MRLTISPEISHVSGQLKNNEGLSVRRSAVSTDVYAESGQTLLLAGMTLESSTNQDSHVPILGRLPLIRWFFTDKSDATEERTPHPCHRRDTAGYHFGRPLERRPMRRSTYYEGIADCRIGVVHNLSIAAAGVAQSGFLPRLATS